MLSDAYSAMLIVLLSGQTITFGASAIMFWRANRSARPLPQESETSNPDPMSFVVIIARLLPAELAKLDPIFDLGRNGHEVLFCTESAEEDVVLELKDRARQAGCEPQLVLAGRTEGKNPKADMMVAGLRAARYDIVVCLDGNAEAGPSLDMQIASAWTETDCLITTLPYARLDANDGVWSAVHAAVLDRVYARWMRFGAYLGLKYSFGKLLAFRRSWLEGAGGVQRLYDACAEDTALSKLAHGTGIHIDFVADPVRVNTAGTHFKTLWARMGRWTKLRRLDLPLVFCLEALNGLWSLLLVGALFAMWFNLSISILCAALFVYWHGLEAMMLSNSKRGWHLSGHLHAILRDGLIPLWWLEALLWPHYAWRAPSRMLADDLNTDQPNAP